MGEKDHDITDRALKQVLLRDQDSIHFLKEMAKDQDLVFSVSDRSGKVLWGAEKELSFQYELQRDEGVFGVLKSDSEKGKTVAELLSILVEKEYAKKKIGKEVLGLYREINMIYNLSEMISETIDSVSIAEIALKEASQIIVSTHGMFLLYDQEEDKVHRISSFGTNPEMEKNIDQQHSILKNLILKGNAAIVPADRIHYNPALRHLKTVMFAPLKVKHRTLGMIILGNEEQKDFRAADLKLLTTIAFQTAAAIESAHLYEKNLKEARDREEAIRLIHETSQKFVPSEFLSSLGKDNITEVSLGDLVEREVTVVFVDIRDFTSISESISPEQNFLFINGFNNRMGPIIRKNNGFILQYLGDGFMALFPKGAQDAVSASVAIHQELHAYNQERNLKDRLPIKVGIGMQNGKLIMGVTGDAERLDAAIISDTVNTAARIEGLSKHYGTSIMLTEECRASLTHPERFNLRYLGPVQLKGKQKPIELYECINGDDHALCDHKLKTLATFDAAMKLYFNKEFAMAAVTFQGIFKMNRNDVTAKLFLNKSAGLITHELEDNWKGIETMTTK